MQIGELVTKEKNGQILTITGTQPVIVAVSGCGDHYEGQPEEFTPVFHNLMNFQYADIDLLHVDDYIRQMSAVDAHFSAFVTEENRQELIDALESYRQGYLKKLDAYIKMADLYTDSERAMRREIDRLRKVCRAYEARLQEGRQYLIRKSKIYRSPKSTNVRVALPKEMREDCHIQQGSLAQWIREGDSFLGVPNVIPTPTSHPIQAMGTQLTLEVDAFVRSFRTEDTIQWEWDEWGGWWRGRIALVVS